MLQGEGVEDECPGTPRRTAALPEDLFATPKRRPRGTSSFENSSPPKTRRKDSRKAAEELLDFKDSSLKAATTAFSAEQLLIATPLHRDQAKKRDLGRIKEARKARNNACFRSMKKKAPSLRLKENTHSRVGSLSWRRRGKTYCSLSANDVATSWQQENPKLKGSDAHRRYELYKRSRTVSEAMQRGAIRLDISHDLAKGFLRITAFKAKKALRSSQQPCASMRSPAAAGSRRKRTGTP